ncbi:GNAT family N-acetyltransferase [Bradyrhizobium cajani]|uniref:GNAT family N-acetyltransferase n=1 Tax=Bradyrhizobium cajani TaxID=1928661 RepID=A0A844T9F0_9BRAD|nr:GNAT family N-acetyltransferase [Bradyrhizobium cajani]MCP3372455.1 acetyltransferase [Bradyrhizobium cajani]MVT75728.1 GNAT family N-acetyltransferase [Bradyrhizobium cajani]
MTTTYTFRPMTSADLPLVRRWLGEAHVVEWWGDPVEQFALVSGDLTEPAMDQYIVLAGNRPFGYLQCYRLTAWNTGFGLQPEGTRGIDQFIGESDMIARGHGSAFIRQFADERLREGPPRIVTDPDPLNLRAVRAYEKAGFVRDRMVETPDGPALLMVRET